MRIQLIFSLLIFGITSSAMDRQSAHKKQQRQYPVNYGASTSSSSPSSQLASTSDNPSSPRLTSPPRSTFPRICTSSNKPDDSSHAKTKLSKKEKIKQRAKTYAIKIYQQIKTGEEVTLPLDRNLLDLIRKELKVQYGSLYEDLMWDFSSVPLMKEIYLIQKLLNKQLILDSLILRVPSTISRLTYLEVLSLRKNYIVFLPETIGLLINLEELNLEKNQIRGLPVTIGNLANLKMLNLNNNMITALPTTIQKLTKLTHFYLNDNKITHLDVIDKLTSLEVLSAENNQLTSCPVNLNQLPNLEIVDLRQNRLSKKERAHIKKQLRNLTDLRL